MSTTRSPGPTPGRIRHTVRSIARIALAAKTARMSGRRPRPGSDQSVASLARRLARWSRTHHPLIEAEIGRLDPRGQGLVRAAYQPARAEVVAGLERLRAAARRARKERRARK